MSTVTAPAGLIAGVWAIDPTHSEFGFSVRHMMVSKVRGRFTKFTGEFTVAENLVESTVKATVDANSIDTNEENRDNHLRSADFFEIEKHPEWTFVSTGIKSKGDDEYVLTGDLTIKGVTRSTDWDLEFNGAGPDAYGGTRSGFTATTEISRKDFGVDIQMPMDGGGVVVGDKIKLHLEVEGILQS